MGGSSESEDIGPLSEGKGTFSRVFGFAGCSSSRKRPEKADFQEERPDTA